MRQAKMTRKTTETQVSVEICLDGTGKCKVETGVGFFNHMLEQLGRHSLIDLNIQANGDLHIDDHHCVEDVGITLGDALCEALGDKRGICRYGSCSLPMDDAWVDVALDLSGRPFLNWNIDFQSEKIGNFDSDLVREFFQALAVHGGISLHVQARSGFNSHHLAEASFKSMARALRMAITTDSRVGEKIPSTKESL